MKTIVLYNGLSGSGVGEQRAGAVRVFWPDRELTFRDMSAIDDYPAFFAALQPDDTLLVCGGDGTLNHFINDTDGIRPENGIYYFPTGSGNDFWRDLGFDENTPPQRIDRYLQNLPVTVIGDSRYRFLNGIGVGLDGYCCEEVNRIHAQTGKKASYLRIAFKGFLHAYRPGNATLIIDGIGYDYRKVWLVSVMNGRYFGGGAMPTPQQDRLSDPKKVTVMVVDGLSRLHAMLALPKILKGNHTKLTKYVHFFEVDAAAVRVDTPAPMQIDGETVPGVVEYRVTARPDEG